MYLKCVLILCMLVFMLLSCGKARQDGEPNLHISARAPVSTFLDGVHYTNTCTVTLPSGATQTIVSEEFVPFIDENAPEWLLPNGAGAHHSFADLFAVIPAPATCAVTAEAGHWLDSIGAFVSADQCQPASKNVAVSEGQTEEVVVIIQCQGNPEGGEDIVTVVNWNPSILSVSLDELHCIDAPGRINAAVSDPEGDLVNCVWSSTGPGIQTITPPETVHQSSHSVEFTGDSPGDYQVTLDCSDPLGGAAGYSFPISIADCQLDTEALCTEEVAMELGPQQQAMTVSADACLKVTQYPGSWVQAIVLQTQGDGTGYPIDFEWSNCENAETDTFNGDWIQVELRPASDDCATVIKLNGSQTENITLRWWGTG